jgi:hypothetical protein
MATNYTVTGLADYVKGNPVIAISNILLEGDTPSLFTTQTGIKASDKVLDLVSTGVDVSNGSYIGVGNYSGGATLKDVTITVVPLFIKEEYTKPVIQGKLAQIAEKLGSNPAEVVFEDVLMELKGKELSLDIEKQYWRNDTDASLWGKSYKPYFDGILKQIDASTTLKSGIAPRALTTDASILEDVAAMVNARPEAFIEIDTILAMPPAHFDKYARALYGLTGAINTLNIDGKPVKQLRVPGTNVFATSVAGLSTTNFMVLTRKENIVCGMDLMGEEDTIEFKYESLIRAYELFATWKQGVKVVRPAEAIINKA